jgi:thymidylate synthase
MYYKNGVSDIRREFSYLLKNGHFTSFDREASMTSIVGSKTIEIIGAAFIVDDSVIFGKVNDDYVAREHAWYVSKSLSVNDFPGGAPEVWKAIASKTDAMVNSNYGYLVYGVENNSQLEHAIAELKKNEESRRAIVIYTRPTMWNDYNVDGRSDFVCTNAVQYVIRDGYVDAIVQMRSNDSHIGYKNDCAWQKTCLREVASAVNYPAGKIYWQVGSLHVYERDFYLVDHYSKTGETSITKKQYNELYPSSCYNR